jgi:hypothetical protein
MEIKLTPQEAEKFYYNALCNGGLNELHYAGIHFEYDKKDYKAASNQLKANGFKGTICLEDVWMEILRMGKTLKFVDVECDGEYSRNVTLDMVHKNSEKLDGQHLLDYVNENDDAVTAFLLLQAVMYDGEIIFG